MGPLTPDKLHEYGTYLIQYEESKKTGTLSPVADEGAALITMMMVKRGKLNLLLDNPDIPAAMLAIYQIAKLIGQKGDGELFPDNPTEAAEQEYSYTSGGSGVN